MDITSTDTEITVKRDEAYKIFNLVADLNRKSKSDSLRLGFLLKIVRDNKSYKYMGDGGFDTFDQFLNNEEIGIARSTAYLYIDLYTFYIEKLEMVEDEVAKLPIVFLRDAHKHLREKTIAEAKDTINDYISRSEVNNPRRLFEQAKDEKIIEDKPEIYKNSRGQFVIKFKLSNTAQIICEDISKDIYSEVNDIVIKLK